MTDNDPPAAWREFIEDTDGPATVERWQQVFADPYELFYSDPHRQFVCYHGDTNSTPEYLDAEARGTGADPEVVNASPVEIPEYETDPDGEIQAVHEMRALTRSVRCPVCGFEERLTETTRRELAVWAKMQGVDWVPLRGIRRIRELIRTE